MVSGEALNKGYFPIMVPLGVLGNILSFLVSTIQNSITFNIGTMVPILLCCLYLVSQKIFKF